MSAIDYLDSSQTSPKRKTWGDDRNSTDLAQDRCAAACIMHGEHGEDGISSMLQQDGVSYCSGHLACCPPPPPFRIKVWPHIGHGRFTTRICSKPCSKITQATCTWRVCEELSMVDSFIRRLRQVVSQKSSVCCVAFQHSQTQRGYSVPNPPPKAEMTTGWKPECVFPGQEAGLCDQQLHQVAGGVPQEVHRAGAQRLSGESAGASLVEGVKRCSAGGGGGLSLVPSPQAPFRVT